MGKGSIPENIEKGNFLLNSIKKRCYFFVVVVVTIRKNIIDVSIV